MSCYSIAPRQPRSTLFPYTTLFRSSMITKEEIQQKIEDVVEQHNSLLEQIQKLEREKAALNEERLALRGQLVILRSEEHTSELQSRLHLVCRLLLENKKE